MKNSLGNLSFDICTSTVSRWPNLEEPDEHYFYFEHLTASYDFPVQNFILLAIDNAAAHLVYSQERREVNPFKRQTGSYRALDFTLI